MDLIIKKTMPVSVFVLLKINPMNFDWKNGNTDETKYFTGMAANIAVNVENSQFAGLLSWNPAWKWGLYQGFLIEAEEFISRDLSILDWE